MDTFLVLGEGTAFRLNLRECFTQIVFGTSDRSMAPVQCWEQSVLKKMDFGYVLCLIGNIENAINENPLEAFSYYKYV